ncbi:MAG: helix-turn-helix domain-containing protein [Kovacikia sp.]
MSPIYSEPTIFAAQDTAQSQFLTPFQRKLLLKSLHTEQRQEYRRRIEIMLLADAGQSQTQICETVGCSQETARYWITMARTGQAHTWNDHPIGRPKTVNDEYLERLRELASHSPREYGYPFQCWTAQWLGKHLAKEFCIEISDRHINRLLKQMGLSTTSQRKQPKPSPHPLDSKDSGIVISNLKSASRPESEELWIFKSVY